VSEAAERAAECAAEAQLDLARIRRARHRLILAVEAKLMPGQEPATLAGRRAEWEEAMEQTIRELSPSLAKVYARKRSTGDIALESELKQLAALERYERRAFSRRKKAFREMSEQMPADADDIG